MLRSGMIFGKMAQFCVLDSTLVRDTFVCPKRSGEQLFKVSVFELGYIRSEIKQGHNIKITNKIKGGIYKNTIFL